MFAKIFLHEEHSAVYLALLVDILGLPELWSKRYKCSYPNPQSKGKKRVIDNWLPKDNLKTLKWGWGCAHPSQVVSSHFSLRPSRLMNGAICANFSICEGTALLEYMWRCFKAFCLFLQKSNRVLGLFVVSYSMEIYVFFFSTYKIQIFYHLYLIILVFEIFVVWFYCLLFLLIHIHVVLFM